MRLGPEALEQLRAEVGGRLEIGHDLVIAGPIALSATAELAAAEKHRTEEYFSAYFQRSCETIEKRYGVPEQICTEAEQAGAALCYEMREGFLAALWKAAEASNAGLSLNLRKVPVRQETIELAELFEKNPYEEAAGGSWLISVARGELFAERMRAKGWTTSVVGDVRRGRERLLYSGEIVRYLDRPARKREEA